MKTLSFKRFLFQSVSQKELLCVGKIFKDSQRISSVQLYLPPEITLDTSNETFEIISHKRMIQKELDTSSFTAFQNEVLRAVGKIPKGQTRSYSDIAYSVKSPKAYRAVATVMAQNSFALLVPCHRVLSVSGIGGYMGTLNGPWIDFKKRLLLLERKREEFAWVIEKQWSPIGAPL